MSPRLQRVKIAPADTVPGRPAVYRRLSDDERAAILELHAAGHGPAAIARALFRRFGTDRTGPTVSRHIKAAESRLTGENG